MWWGWLEILRDQGGESCESLLLMLWTGTVLVVMTSLIFWISASRAAILSLYRLIAASVLSYSSCRTSFSEVTAYNFSDSALAVD